VAGVRESDGRSLAVSLAAFLRSYHLLLVVDNFEQVIDAALVLHDLLVEAPGLQLLVTSRMLLRLAGEQEYAVLPLPLPALSAVGDVDQLAQNPAVQLFAQRARALQGAFHLTAENAVTVGEICRRLDGLPLAIELAAARVRVLPPQQLLVRLEQRLPLLTGGVRTLPARQHTLRATIQWSWDLLSPVDQMLFRQLGVFAGGFSLEAAEAVCSADDAVEVLAALESLVDQSLVQQQARDGEARFSLLATLREFALEQLDLSGEAAALRRRHAAYYRDLGERGDAACWERGQWVSALVRPCDRERDNLLTALQWALDQEDTELGVRLAASLGIWFFYRAPGEGRRLLTQALGLPRAATWRTACGWLLYAIGAYAVMYGEMQAAVAHWERAAASFRAAEDLTGLSATLVLLSTATAMGESARAFAIANEALSLARQTDNRHLIAFVEAHAGYTGLLHGGDVGTVRGHLETALALARALDADWVLVETLTYLGELAYAEGQRQEARRLWLEVRPLAEAFGERWYVARTYIYPALLASADGEHRQAAAEWRGGITLAEDVGSTPLLTICLAGLAEVVTAQQQPARAAQLLGAAHRLWGTVETHAIYEHLFRAAYARSLGATRPALAEPAFAQAWAEGEMLSLEQATDLALAALADLTVSEAVDPAAPTSRDATHEA
jgi:predicted ATPase